MKTETIISWSIIWITSGKILYHTKSSFQDILIFKSTNFGNVLVLNGIIQCTEKDEFAYQELITHLPIMSHPSPKKS